MQRTLKKNGFWFVLLQGPQRTSSTAASSASSREKLQALAAAKSELALHRDVSDRIGLLYSCHLAKCKASKQDAEERSK